MPSGNRGITLRRVKYRERPVVTLFKDGDRVRILTYKEQPKDVVARVERGGKVIWLKGHVGSFSPTVLEKIN